MLIEGRHPLCTPSDDEESYLQKLRNPVWDISDTFSTFAKDLFLKLCNPSPIERYITEKALRHPWITRDF